MRERYRLFSTNSNGMYLGDATLEPVFEELGRRKTVAYVHPNPSPDAVVHSLGLPDNLLDFPTDTNRAVAQVHYTNRFARTPNVKYIFSHAGGSIPYGTGDSYRGGTSQLCVTTAPQQDFRIMAVLGCNAVEKADYRDEGAMSAANQSVAYGQNTISICWRLASTARIGLAFCFCTASQSLPTFGAR